MQGGSRAGIRQPTLTTPLPERPPSPGKQSQRWQAQLNSIKSAITSLKEYSTNGLTSKY